MKKEHQFHVCPACHQKENFWDRHMTPRLINMACGLSAFKHQRSRLVPKASGVVVELGTGTGLNFPFYLEDKIDRLKGIDPALSLIKRAQRKTRDVDFHTEIYCDTAEKMPFEDASADCVVSTYTMCSIPDIDTALNEIRRILKPGGKLYFSEHGLSDNPKVQKTQNKIDPYWGMIAGGCHINRDMTTLIRKAGFAFETHENFTLRNIPEFLGYHHFGVAIKEG